MEYKLQIKRTKDLLEKEISEIIFLKQQFWNYPFEKQKFWFEQNICENDMHFLLFKDKELSAYLNAIKTYAIIDGKRIDIIGIGNVCVDSKLQKKGTGRLLMEKLNAYLDKNQLCGMLLCKDNLTDFYKKTGWILLKPQYVTVNAKKFNNNVMSYRTPQATCDKISKIELERNF